MLVDLFTSLDGFAADPAGPQDFTFPFMGPELGRFMGEVLGWPHVLVMGRRTYELLGAFWPHAEAPQAPAMNALPKLVFSRQLQGPLARENARLTEGELADEIRTLKAEDGPPQRVIGSLALGRELLSLGLVDTVRLVMFPVALGAQGREPIFGGHPPRALHLVHSQVLDGGTLVLEYGPGDPVP